MQDKAEANERLTEQMVGMETELTKLRVKADQVQM